MTESATRATPPEPPKPAELGRPAIPVLAALLGVYVLLRALAWSNTYLLEDHDSILYIDQIRAFMTFDPAVIFGLSPDVTPFYPFFAGLMSLPGWSAEAGARLCSLVFSAVLFLAAAGILGRITTPAGTVYGLLVLALSPWLITFSISILSEPTYIAVAYVGLWYYLARHDSTSPWHAVGLGLVFGLTFLNRLEGLVFLLVVPLLQAVFLLGRHGTLRAALRPAARWTLLYAAGYIIVAAPQVLLVSEKMDRFALNGREIWAQLLLSEDAASYEEKIYGLDYSDDEINLKYFQKNSSELAQSAPTTSVLHLAETFLRNIDKFYAVQIGKLGGSLLVALFFAGLLQLWQSRLYFPLLALAGFAVAFLLPGLATDPKPRAVASVVPLFALLAGPGMLFASRQVCAVRDRLWLARAVPAALFTLLLAVWLVPLVGIYAQKKLANFEYSLVDLEPVIEVLHDVADGLADGSATVTARKQYLSYLSGQPFVPLPYTDMDGLLRYCRSNDVDVLFLQHRLLETYPFMQQLADSGSTPGLSLLYGASDDSGAAIELYRVVP